ncbi:MAG: type III-A CRISPR-associated RAMP protein Csm5, partial [Hymenobacteraceae bacterium]|nr:type III-A CRISPR-associated RAMP protein Csm5 [Hymenobacteraceae bacterium]
LSVIGEENLDQWVSLINKKGSLLNYLKDRKNNLKPSEVAQRILKIQGDAPQKGQPVREHLYSGNGEALLPGSSLKGAFRTALFANMVTNKPEAAKVTSLKNNRNKFSDKDLQKLFMGKDPNHDLLRLLRVGDVHFPDAETVCLQVNNLSENSQGSYINKQVLQYAECLPENAVSVARLQVPQDLVKQLKQPAYRSAAPKSIETVEDLKSMLARVNEHTRQLVEEELELYREYDLPHEAADWVDALQNILEETHACGPGECVLRVGFGAGFHFMTGGWQADILPQAVQEEIGKAARPPHYRGPALPLPRSRRMVLQGKPLGFVKISLLNEDEAASELGKINKA